MNRSNQLAGLLFIHNIELDITVESISIVEVLTDVVTCPILSWSYVN